MFLQFEIESLCHFFLLCHFFTNIHCTFLEELAKIDLNTLNLCENSIVEVLLYGSSAYDMNQKSDQMLCCKIEPPPDLS